jgi:exodeoxyribonuclease VII small subunit
MPENKKETNLTFEKAMQRLDEIVEQMEANKLPLEELLTGYEEGLKLVKLCSEKLDAAEKRIEIITRDATGKPQVAEFEPSKPAPAPAPSRSEDISLF